jgi:glycosyltransferase involved in cell wall biosynthesis
VQLAGALAARGHRVDIVLARSKGHFLAEVPQSVRLVELNAPPAVMALPALVRRPADARALLPAMLEPGVAQVLGAIPKLVRYLNKEQPDALLGALDYANIAAILSSELATPSIRTIASVHNHLSSAVANAERPHLRHVIPLARRFYPLADGIVCVSNGVAEDLAKRLELPVNSISTVYNPVVTDDLAELARAPIPHRWLEEKQCPVILGVGKLKRQKDFATLIEAFSRVRKTRSAKLIILGDGPCRADLQLLAERLNVAQDVDLAGFDPNPYAYMSRAGVFALSSALAAAILDQLTFNSAPGAARNRALEFDTRASAANYEKILFPN